MVQARISAKEFFNADERLADLGLIAVPGAEELAAMKTSCPRTTISRT